MSRKDYNRIANAIADNLNEEKEYTKAQIALILANALKGTNPRYDSARFYRACMQR